jgi:hypothetical protein
VTEELQTRWRPLSVRESGEYADYDTLHPGVPRWLRSSLWSWVTGQLRFKEDFLRIERTFRTELWATRSGRDGALAELQEQVSHDQELFLDVVDFLLSGFDPQRHAIDETGFYEPSQDVQDVLALTRMLSEAGSLWKVAAISDRHFGLVRRMPQEVEAAAEQVMGKGDKAAQHLRLAWHAVYGRQPDPSKGYREAIKAVEAAAIPVVCPANPRATLGRVINDLRAKPSKWVVDLKHPTPDRQVETVADMLDLIWKGQSDRHGDPDPAAPISVSQEQAEAAVHLAVTVVQWFTMGVIAPVGSSSHPQ